MLEHHTAYVRKKIALGITIGAGVILLGVLLFLYTGERKPAQKNDTLQGFSAFYATILEQTQSFFDKNRAILNGQ